MQVKKLKYDTIKDKNIISEDKESDIKFHYNYFQTLTLYYTPKIERKKIFQVSKGKQRLLIS